MEDTLISFETAKIAKEKGFNWKVNNYLQLKTISGGVFEEHLEESMQDINSDFPLNPLFSRPTQSLLQKWLRVHNIDITVYPVEMKTETRSVFQEIKDKEYAFYISIGGIQQFDTVKVFTTYEDALEAGLLEGLKLIK